MNQWNGNNGFTPNPGMPMGQQAQQMPMGQQAQQMPMGQQAQQMPMGQQAQQMPMGQQAQQMPTTYNIPNDAAVQEALARAKEANSPNKNGANISNFFVTFPGPQGAGQKWDSVSPGYSSSVFMYVLPNAGDGSGFFVEEKSHFYKSLGFPQGASIPCIGEGCKICASRQAAFDSGDDELYQKAKAGGWPRHSYLYNVVVLDDYQGHFDSEGQMRPKILRAGKQLHEAILNLMAERGIANIMHPDQGRPLKVTKTKTGPNRMNIEYSVIDANPSPLPQEFRPVWGSLWQLNDLIKQVEEDQLFEAINFYGFPRPSNTLVQGVNSNGFTPPSPNYSQTQQNPQSVGSYQPHITNEQLMQMQQNPQFASPNQGQQMQQNPQFAPPNQGQQMQQGQPDFPPQVNTAPMQQANQYQPQTTPMQNAPNSNQANLPSAQDLMDQLSK